MPATLNSRLAVAVLTTAIVHQQPSFASSDFSRRHIELISPQPFVFNEFGPTNPLNPDGSDYPCKVPHGQSFKVSGSPAQMVIGEEQTASFRGSAVHGGGSCQFALAEGLEPTNETAWKVIHSVEGGCPKANIEGNLQDGQSPDEYPFTIPDDFTPGDYTFAWTWVNRIGGQPEFYMNCAPIKLKAAAAACPARSQRPVPAPYPDLFLANIGGASNGCDTAAALARQVAILYPAPGASVSSPNGRGGLFRQPCDGNPRNNNGSAASSSGAAPSEP